MSCTCQELRYILLVYLFLLGSLDSKSFPGTRPEPPRRACQDASRAKTARSQPDQSRGCFCFAFRLPQFAFPGSFWDRGSGRWGIWGVLGDASGSPAGMEVAGLHCAAALPRY